MRFNRAGVAPGGTASSNGSSLSAANAAGTAGGLQGAGSGIASNRSSSVQYNPAGDTRNRIKTSSLEIAFLGIKILLVCYESQLNKEWFRIARAIKDMGNRSGPQGESCLFSKLSIACVNNYELKWS